MPRPSYWAMSRKWEKIRETLAPKPEIIVPRDLTPDEAAHTARFEAVFGQTAGPRLPVPRYVKVMVGAALDVREPDTMHALHARSADLARGYTEEMAVLRQLTRNMEVGPLLDAAYWVRDGLPYLWQPK